MAPVWPPSIDSTPLADGYSEGFPNNTTRSQPDAGPAKVRLSAGMRPARFSASWLFRTYADLQVFRAWVNNRTTGLAGGVRSFEWTHPITRQALRMRFVPAGEESLFSATPVGARAWRVDAQFEVMP